MDDVGRVHVVAAGENLEHEILQMVVSQVLSGVNDAMHVGLHQLCDDVNVFVAGGRRRSGHLE